MIMKKIMTAAFCAAAALALASPALAAAGAEKGDKKEVAQAGRYGSVNYKITFKVTYDILESSGAVYAVDRGDADYFESGDIALLVGEENGKAEYRIRHFQNKAMFKPAADPRDGEQVTIECHFELGGPVTVTGPGRHDATMNFRTTARVKLGKPVVLLDKPGSRIEVMVEAVK